MNLGTLYEKILSFLERFLLLFIAWYEGQLTERAKTSIINAEKLSEAIKEKTHIKQLIEAMSKDEKTKIAVSDD